MANSIKSSNESPERVEKDACECDKQEVRGTTMDQEVRRLWSCKKETELTIVEYDSNWITLVFSSRYEYQSNRLSVDSNISSNIA